MQILIVESAPKARTLQKYLGKGWKVLATGGHVETLPFDRAVSARDASKAYWANRPGELPTPPWVWTDRGEKAVREILDAAGDDPVFWLATDPDREGEFIAWCLERLLAPHGPTHRVTFQEVTEEAVKRALENPHSVDQAMVDSALVRKYLDRMVGFRTSRTASSVVPGTGASMGRVQTPTLGFVVERELEREAHVPIPYFEARALASGIGLAVRFHEPDDPDAWRDEAGKADPQRTFDGDLARGAVEALEAAGSVTITGVRASSRTTKPRPPFTTDALLQAAGSRFGWSPRKTSALASMLYDEGHITYIRTDSTRLAASAVEKARGVVRDSFGDAYLGAGAAAPVSAGPTQDAHEAIRPTRLELDEVAVDDADARRLYRLVRAQALASQMAPATSAVRSLEARCDGLERPLTGSVSWETFAGWRAAWAEFDGERPSAPPDALLEEGARWELDPATDEAPNPLLVEDETRPPGRYRPHTLIRAMKDAGIGRPSTYARTVEKLEERGYVELEDGALVPTERGRVIWLDAAPLYVGRTGDAGDGGGGGGGGDGLRDTADRRRDAPDSSAEIELFSPEFTARLEEGLDRIAAGQVPAPATWERWRDLVRDLHEAARERRNAGSLTLRTRRRMERLLQNASEELLAQEIPEGTDPATLSEGEARELANRLQAAGVQPAPTPEQLGYIRSLAEDLAMNEAEAAALGGAASFEAIGTSAQASQLIEELRRLHDERRPPSARQRRFIEDLAKQAGLAEADAAALVDAASFDDLTGGAEGTASALIEVLKARVEPSGG